MKWPYDSPDSLRLGGRLFQTEQWHHHCGHVNHFCYYSKKHI